MEIISESERNKEIDNIVQEQITHYSLFEKVSDETMQQRRDICAMCPSRKSIVGFEFCGECGCHIKTKTRYKVHVLQKDLVVKCPLGKW